MIEASINTRQSVASDRFRFNTAMIELVVAFVSVVPGSALHGLKNNTSLYRQRWQNDAQGVVTKLRRLLKLSSSNVGVMHLTNSSCFNYVGYHGWQSSLSLLSLLSLRSFYNMFMPIGPVHNPHHGFIRGFIIVAALEKYHR